MTINFIANYKSGYVGEIGDAVHLAQSMEALGHTVRRIPQDEWREYVIEGFPKGKYPNIPNKLVADINIICKWFYDGSFIEKLRNLSLAPVFYWTWDYMQGEDWHMKMVKEADLYLGNDVRSGHYTPYKNAYYFPFDVADGMIPRFDNTEKTIDVAFFGSWIGQGDRQKWLTEINKTNPVTVFSWNYKDWPKEFNANPPVYGLDFARCVADSKIILGLSVEPNSWGYWSNRVGKVLTQGGFLLYQYAPGMELFLGDAVEYFSSVGEAREKIDHYLIADEEREKIARRGVALGQNRFTSQARVKQLMILVERYLKKGDAEWKI